MSADAAPDFLAKRSALARFVSTYGQEIVIAGAIDRALRVVSAINPRFLGANNLNTIISGNAYIAVSIRLVNTIRSGTALIAVTVSTTSWPVNASFEKDA